MSIDDKSVDLQADFKDTVFEPNSPSPLRQTVLEATDVHAFDPKETLAYNEARAIQPTSSALQTSTPASEPLFASSSHDALQANQDVGLVTTMIPDESSEHSALELPTHIPFDDPMSTYIRRTTILPKSQKLGDTPQLALNTQERYEELDCLGEGAAGEVLLAKDNDIQRMVALKRLKKKHNSSESLARFVEEIQTVGQLEHPNIVPIHDVGLNEEGQYYFVMKYVEGQTMAEIIRKLNAGDPETHAKYTFNVRNQIFLKVLQAVQFAHKRGIIHRDIKPENIMVGAYGQVMLMDWGIAKRIRNPLSGQHTIPSGMKPPIEAFLQENASFKRTESAASAQTHDPDRLFATRTGTLIGTPAYMPPEQALGQIEYIDERSDIYSLSALYYEWMSLRHYLEHKMTVSDLLWGIIQEEVSTMDFLRPHPKQGAIPAEFSYFCIKGLSKDPGARYQSIEEMIQYLQAAMSGRFDVHCPVTFMKRNGNEALRFIDRHPKGMMLGMGLVTLFVLLGTIQMGTWLMAWIFKANV